MNRKRIETGIIAMLSLLLVLCWWQGTAAQNAAAQPKEPAAKAAAAAPVIEPAKLLAEADKLFKAKNYKDAAVKYEAFVEAVPKHDMMHRASRRVIACQLRLQLFNEALDAADNYIERTKDTYHEARAQRLAGNLAMNIPHWGTRA